MVLTFPAKESVLRMRFRGANRNPAMEGVAPLPGKPIICRQTSHPAGANPLPAISSGCAIRDVYPGIDAVYYGQPSPA